MKICSLSCPSCWSQPRLMAKKVEEHAGNMSRPHLEIDFWKEGFSGNGLAKDLSLISVCGDCFLPRPAPQFWVSGRGELKLIWNSFCRNQDWPEPSADRNRSFVAFLILSSGFIVEKGQTHVPQGFQDFRPSSCHHSWHTSFMANICVDLPTPLNGFERV